MSEAKKFQKQLGNELATLFDNEFKFYSSKIGAIGFEGCWDYSAIGTVSNLASRLCDEAKGCEILITQKVLSCINGLVEAESLKPLTLKRLAHPVPTFNIVRLKT